MNPPGNAPGLYYVLSIPTPNGEIISNVVFCNSIQNTPNIMLQCPTNDPKANTVIKKMKDKNIPTTPSKYSRLPQTSTNAPTQPNKAIHNAQTKVTSGPRMLCEPSDKTHSNTNTIIPQVSTNTQNKQMHYVIYSDPSKLHQQPPKKKFKEERVLPQFMNAQSTAMDNTSKSVINSVDIQLSNSTSSVMETTINEHIKPQIPQCTVKNKDEVDSTATRLDDKIKSSCTTLGKIDVNHNGNIPNVHVSNNDKSGVIVHSDTNIIAKHDWNEIERSSMKLKNLLSFKNHDMYKADTSKDVVTTVDDLDQLLNDPLNNKINSEHRRQIARGAVSFIEVLPPDNVIKQDHSYSKRTPPELKFLYLGNQKSAEHISDNTYRLKAMNDTATSSGVQAQNCKPKEKLRRPDPELIQCKKHRGLYELKDECAVKVGETFASTKEFADYANKHGPRWRVYYKTTYSRSVEAAKKKNQILSSAHICIFARQRSVSSYLNKGLRQRREKYKSRCPSRIILRMMRDRDDMTVVYVCHHHDHPLTDELFHSLSHCNRLPLDVKEEMYDLISLNLSRSILAKYISAITGLPFCRKHLDNEVQKVKSNNIQRQFSDEKLEQLMEKIKKLKDTYGDSRKQPKAQHPQVLSTLSTQSPVANKPTEKQSFVVLSPGPMKSNNLDATLSSCEDLSQYHTCNYKRRKKEAPVPTLEKHISETSKSPNKRSSQKRQGETEVNDNKRSRLEERLESIAYHQEVQQSVKVVQSSVRRSSEIEPWLQHTTLPAQTLPNDYLIASGIFKNLEDIRLNINHSEALDTTQYKPELILTKTMNDLNNEPYQYNTNASEVNAPDVQNEVVCTEDNTEFVLEETMNGNDKQHFEADACKYNENEMNTLGVQNGVECTEANSELVLDEAMNGNDKQHFEDDACQYNTNVSDISAPGIQSVIVRRDEINAFLRNLEQNELVEYSSATTKTANHVEQKCITADKEVEMEPSTKPTGEAKSDNVHNILIDSNEITYVDCHKRNVVEEHVTKYNIHKYMVQEKFKKYVEHLAKDLNMNVIDLLANVYKKDGVIKIVSAKYPREGTTVTLKLMKNPTPIRCQDDTTTELERYKAEASMYYNMVQKVTAQIKTNISYVKSITDEYAEFEKLTEKKIKTLERDIKAKRDIIDVINKNDQELQVIITKLEKEKLKHIDICNELQRENVKFQGLNKQLALQQAKLLKEEKDTFDCICMLKRNLQCAISEKNTLENKMKLQTDADMERMRLEKIQSDSICRELKLVRDENKSLTKQLALQHTALVKAENDKINGTSELKKNLLLVIGEKMELERDVKQYAEKFAEMEKHMLMEKMQKNNIRGELKLLKEKNESLNKRLVLCKLEMSNVVNNESSEIYMRDNNFKLQTKRIVDMENDVICLVTVENNSSRGGLKLQSETGKKNDSLNKQLELQHSTFSETENEKSIQVLELEKQIKLLSKSIVDMKDRFQSEKLQNDKLRGELKMQTEKTESLSKQLAMQLITFSKTENNTPDDTSKLEEHLKRERNKNKEMENDLKLQAVKLVNMENDMRMGKIKNKNVRNDLKLKDNESESLKRKLILQKIALQEIASLVNEKDREIETLKNKQAGNSNDNMAKAGNDRCTDNAKLSNRESNENLIGIVCDVITDVTNIREQLNKILAVSQKTNHETTNNIQSVKNKTSTICKKLGNVLYNLGNNIEKTSGELRGNTALTEHRMDATNDANMGYYEKKHEEDIASLDLVNSIISRCDNLLSNQDVGGSDKVNTMVNHDDTGDPIVVSVDTDEVCIISDDENVEPKIEITETGADSAIGNNDRLPSTYGINPPDLYDTVDDKTMIDLLIKDSQETATKDLSSVKKEPGSRLSCRDVREMM